MHAKTKPAFALLLVLILVAAGVILGSSLLTVASLRRDIAGNYAAVARARYLAESGLAMGLFMAQYTPEVLAGTDTKPLGPFSLDGSADTFVISARASTDVAGQYTLTSTATVGGVRRTSSATVLRAVAPIANVGMGVLVGVGLTWLPSSVTITGNVHANGTLFNYATIRGNASATDTVTDPFGRINGTIENLAKAVSVPALQPNNYFQYRLAGVTYSAVTFTADDLKSDDPLTNGGAVTPGNVGGVVHLKPKSGNTPKLKKNLNFTGTLVVNGDLLLDDEGIKLTAVQGFPAIVATGKVLLKNRTKNVVIDGMVLAGQGIWPAESNSSGTGTAVNGLVVSQQTAFASGLAGTHTVNFGAKQATVYDFSQTINQNDYPKVTVVTWHD